MPTVKFNSPDEFCEELQKDQEKVARRIVRCTNQTQSSRLSANIKLVTVLATYAVRNSELRIVDLVRLERFCGELWGINEEEDQKVWDRAEEIRKKIEAVCAASGLELRAGNID